jgi:hypothetical protein
MDKVTLLTVSVIILLGGLTYLIVDKTEETKSKKIIEEKYQTKEDEVKLLGKETSQLKKIIKEKEEKEEELKEKLIVTSGKLASIFGEGTLPFENKIEETQEEIINLPPESECETINAKVLNFFSFLDERDYIKEYQLENGIYAYLKELIVKLSKQTPVVGEEHFPDEILTNAYHFYRILQKSNILLIKDIIDKEKDIMEQTMRYFYLQQIRCEDSQKIFPSFGVLYNYAHFFWKTLGGKAYIFRLDTKSKILLMYYTTMIIHEANLREMNKFGVDIRPQIEKLENELSNYSELSYIGKYLYELSKIKKNYAQTLILGPS